MESYERVSSNTNGIDEVELNPFPEVSIDEDETDVYYTSDSRNCCNAIDWLKLGRSAAVYVVVCFGIAFLLLGISFGAELIHKAPVCDPNAFCPGWCSDQAGSTPSANEGGDQEQNDAERLHNEHRFAALRKRDQRDGLRVRLHRVIDSSTDEELRQLFDVVIDGKSIGNVASRI